MKSNEEIIKAYHAQKEKEKRYWAKQQLILVKARKAGITVTDVEIDSYIKGKK
jgi:hypothetical protein